MSAPGTELFELCRKVYDRTAWDNGDQWFLTNVNEPERVIGKARPRIFANDSDYSNGYRTDVPLYTSDYLLGKLPQFLDNSDDDRRLTVQPLTNMKWCASYDNVDAIQDSTLDSFADTPLKALLKLTIALDDAGELNHA